ncbi:MAG TPA: fatty acyl-AMP ligase, partial [Vicinamibacterales bacterium]|nr:fatty acyl-AMP ligase [Vicinamibacterales bacterium]
VAQSLLDAGLGRGDLVALVVGDAEGFLTSLFGASMAGVVPASLYPPATTGDLPHYFEVTAGVLRSAGARAVVTSRTLAPGFELLRGSCPELGPVLVREDLDASPNEPRYAPTLDDLAFVQFTSGSTSSPKGVALSHRNVAANVEAIRSDAGLAIESSDVALSWLPLYHDMGLVGMVFCPLYSSRPAVLMTPQSFVKRPADWLRAMTRYQASISFAPNFAYDLCVRRVKGTDLEGLDLSCWRIAGCGSEPINASTLAAFAEKFGPVGFKATSFVPSYGLAEHAVAAAFTPQRRLPLVERIAADDLADGRVAVPIEDTTAVEVVSCGRAFPDHTIRIVDDCGRPLPDRQVGEITLAGPSVMVGYYRDDVSTAQVLRDGWLYTGDLGYLVGSELFVCGRTKELIIVNGRKYHPQDLEWAVDGLAGVRRGRAVAFGVTEHGHSDRVIIVAEPSGTVTWSDLVAAVRRRIGDLFGLSIDEVILVPSGTIGRTTSGKVQRVATKARYECGELAASSARA